MNRNVTVSRTTNKKRCVFIGLVFVLLSSVVNFTYRPYIYANQINDLHLADSFSNLFAVPAALFFISGIRSRVESIDKLVPATVLAFILYEFIGLVGLHGRFDIYDIVATIISGAVTWFVLRNVVKVQSL